MNEWTLSTCLDYVSYIDTLSLHSNAMTSWPRFPCIPMLWRHDKVFRHIKSSATSHHSFITTVAIQHLVSDRLLSLISQEGVRVMVLNATFNNISGISWLLVSLVKETRVPRENHGPAISHWQTLSHNVVSSTCYNLTKKHLICIVIKQIQTFHWLQEQTIFFDISWIFGTIYIYYKLYVKFYFMYFFGS